jgi:hypothetical protein
MLGMFAVATGCLSSSTPASDSDAAVDSPSGSDGTASTGDAHGVDGGSDATAMDSGEASSVAPEGGGDTGSCTLPSCLTNLESNCMPSGACTQTLDVTTGNIYTCYANGVIVAEVTNASNNQTLIVKKGASACYTIAFNYYSMGSGDVTNTSTVNNGSDAAVASLLMTVPEAGGNPTWSVTCAGSAAVEVPSSCENNEWPYTFFMTPGEGPSGCTNTTTDAGACSL